MTSRSATNDGYSWTPPVRGTSAYGANGLNQDAASASAGGYDANGNQTQVGSAAGSRTYGYDGETPQS